MKDAIKTVRDLVLGLILYPFVMLGIFASGLGVVVVYKIAIEDMLPSNLWFTGRAIAIVLYFVVTTLWYMLVKRLFEKIEFHYKYGRR